ncbi:MAG: inorganic diphosphatase [Anaplasmataceae bacterium]|nr:inorganic diphosphatase [Anaplasmataceae bacterium]
MNIPIGDKSPAIVNAVIEIPKGSHNKYEYDEELKVIKLDRVLYSPLFYPTDYGFIPETRSEDGDHLDIMVLGGDPTFPGCVVAARPIGLLKMIDGGDEDFKILAVQKDNPRFDKIETIEDMKNFNPHLLDEVAHFFKVYKDLQKKEVKILDWEGKDEALKEIKRAQEMYK